MINFFLNSQTPKTDKSPTHWGKVEIDGVMYKVAGWQRSNQKGEYISVQLTPDEGAPAQTPHNQAKADGYQPVARDLKARDLDMEIPF